MSTSTFRASYPDFPHAAETLVKYIASEHIFTIQLVSEQIVHFEPKDPENFKKWLNEAGVLDIK